MPQQILWMQTTPDAPWIQRREVEWTQTCPETLVLTQQRDQTISGFGGCFNELGWIALEKMSPEARRQVLDKLFDAEQGCGFTLCRLPVGANDYARSWYSLDEVEGDYALEHFSIARDHESLIPYIRAAQAYVPGMRFFASPWSPPTWMKFPMAHNHGTLVWEDRVLKAYAQYLLKFVQAYGQAGIPISQLHVQNEPMSDQKFPSCVWTGEQFRQFIGEYLGPLFEREGVDTEIWLGTLNGPETDHRYLHTTYDQYANLVLSDPEARQYIRGVSYQWAGKYAMQQTHESWPEIALMQTENECGDGTNTWPYAHYIANLYRHYFANGASAYIYWNMVLEPGGNSTWGWRQNAMITVDPARDQITYNPEFYVMKHYSNFIQPGAVRLKTQGHWTGNCVAFENPDGKRVIVMQNNMPKTRDFTLVDGQTHFTVTAQPFSLNTFVLG